MITRLRALGILLGLMGMMAATAYLLVAASGSVGQQPKRAIRVAGAKATDLAPFKGEVLVWASGGLSADEVRRVRDSVRVAAISAVRSGFLPVASVTPGYPVIPVETMAVNPDAYAAAAGSAGERLAPMLSIGVVLSRTGAALRKLRTGGRLRLTGRRFLRVGGVVDDHLLAGYEAAVSLDRGQRLGIGRVAYALLRPRGTLDSLKASVRRLLDGRQVGFQLPQERPWFRAGGGPLPLAQAKVRFGEFAVKSLARPAPEPRWVRANIATRTVPVLGLVRCHRLILNDLAAAMEEVQRQRLAGLVDAAAFHRSGGCSGRGPVAGERGGLSTSAWRTGFDLVASGRPAPGADPRLVAVMARHGFTWEGRWLRAEGRHFEWVGAGA